MWTLDQIRRKTWKQLDAELKENSGMMRLLRPDVSVSTERYTEMEEDQKRRAFYAAALREEMSLLEAEGKGFWQTP